MPDQAGGALQGVKNITMMYIEGRLTVFGRLYVNKS